MTVRPLPVTGELTRVATELGHVSCSCPPSLVLALVIGEGKALRQRRSTHPSFLEHSGSEGLCGELGDAQSTFVVTADEEPRTAGILHEDVFFG